MRKCLIGLLSLVISVSVSAHCPIEFKSENLCASLEWKNPPKINVNNSFKLMFWENGDQNHVPTEPKADLNLKTWMVMANGHSHGGAAMTWSEIEEGVYEVNDAKFFMHGMKGHWEIKVQLLDNGDLVEENTVKVNLDGASNGGGHDH